MFSKVVPEALLGCRKAYRAARQASSDEQTLLEPDFQKQQASDLINRLIAGDAPCLICRFGSGELSATQIHFYRRERGNFFQKSLRYVRGEIGPFLWHRTIRSSMHNNTGFFPPTNDRLEKFGEQMIDDMQHIDVLGSWRAEEKTFRPFFPKAKIIPIDDLEPYNHVRPWSEALHGKKVLVVHPFKTSIEKQYARRQTLFENPAVLPEFDLKVIRSVQSAAGVSTEFEDWFEALDSMRDEIGQTDFDIALIGAGAYGMPLASYIKRLGKKAVHLGGVTQLLFGIKGKRWDNRGLYNENWVRPLPSEIPQHANRVEGGCYW